MKILAINTVHWGSTGRIMHSICKSANKNGHITISYAPAGTKLDIDNKVFGYQLENRISSWLSRITGLNDLFSIFGTLDLIRKIRLFKPDIIHLHNLHEWYLCIPLLFYYIKKNNIPIVWTFHDCWPFTGKCTHYVSTECEKWKNCCNNCPELSEYPMTYIDATKVMWKIKQKCFTSISDLTIVTPSIWLMKQVNNSFLQNYPKMIINNGIDRKIFKPYFNKQKNKQLRERKKIILGVSSVWNNKKGLDVFLDLDKKINNRFQIILVGISKEIENEIPKSIKTIRRTNDRKELAELYSISDIFVNPTREDTFPTVNMEAISCGTPVVTFDVCGSPEIIKPGCGIVVKKDNVTELIRAIEIITENQSYYENNCIKASSSFDEEKCFSKYVSLYENIYQKRFYKK